MKVAIGQINTTSADVEGNLCKAERCVERAAGAGADLLVLPQYALSGWMPGALAREPSFVRRQQEGLGRLVQLSRRVAVAVGHVDPQGGGSAVSLLVDGRVADQRGGARSLPLCGAAVSLTLGGPPARSDADLAVCLCSEPFRYGEGARRERAWREAAADFGVPLITNIQLAKRIAESFAKKRPGDLIPRAWQDYA